MKIGRESLSLFGVDLAGIYEFWRDGMRDAWASPWGARLVGAEPVRVIHPDGRAEVRLGPGGKTLPAGTKTHGTAVLLPEALLLVKEVELPDLSARQAEAMLGLKAESLSPFPRDELVWGWHSGLSVSGARVATVVMASRATVTGVIERAGVAADAPGVEVWSGAGPFVLMRGFGEGARLSRERRMHWLLAGAFVAALAVLLAIAATPVRDARVRLDDAQAKVDALATRAEPAIRTREHVVGMAAALDKLGARFGNRPDEVSLLETLSKVVPDDAMVLRFELRGGQLRLSGQARDAAQVLQILSDSKVFSHIKSLAPFSRGSNGRESFLFEIQLQAPDESA